MKNQSKELLTFDQTHKFLNIKPTHLRSLVFKNEIPYLKVGRLLRLDLEKIESWLESKTLTSDLYGGASDFLFTSP